METPSSPRQDLSAHPALAWMSGTIVPLAEAKVSVQDAALQHGHGVFETMLARQGRILFADAHLRLLAASARTLGIAVEPPIAEIRTALRALAEAMASEAFVRLKVVLSPGTQNLLDPRSEPLPHFWCTAVPIADPSLRGADGVRACIAALQVSAADPTAGHKTLQYSARLQTLRALRQKGYAEGVVLDTDGNICSGLVSNVFWVRNGVVETPAASDLSGGKNAPVRPGVARSWCIRELQGRGLEVREGSYAVKRLREAEELWFCNAVSGVLQSTRLDGQESMIFEGSSFDSPAAAAWVRWLQEAWCQAHQG